MTLDRLAIAIQKDFAAIRAEVAPKFDVLEDQIHQCATHGDLADLRQELLEEIGKIKYAKEIDELRAPVVRVAEKLGLKESRRAA